MSGTLSFVTRHVLAAGYFVAVTAVVSLLLCRAWIRLANRLGVVDRPGPRKIHAEPVPTMGGVAFFAAFSLVLWGHVGAGLLFGEEAWFRSAVPEALAAYVPYLRESLPRLAALYGGAAAVFLVGLLDDLRDLSVAARLAVQFLAAGAAVLLGVVPDIAWLPRWVEVAGTAVWLMAVMNAFNFLDGADGLAAGVGAIITILVAALLLQGYQPQGMFVAAIFAGALLGFLVPNFHPARVFMGNCGSFLIGYVCGVLAILSSLIRAPSTLYPVLSPFLLLALPFYDLLSVLFIRYRLQKPLTKGDRFHFVHRLLRIGMTHRQAVYLIYVVTAALSVNALLLPGLTTVRSVVVIVQFAATVGVLVVLERVARAAELRRLNEQRNGARPE